MDPWLLLLGRVPREIALFGVGLEHELQRDALEFARDRHFGRGKPRREDAAEVGERQFLGLQLPLGFHFLARNLELLVRDVVPRAHHNLGVVEFALVIVG